jgi:O-antigen/teichoic acid export membrane protein
METAASTRMSAGCSSTPDQVSASQISRSQIRGSSLLLSGRLIAALINFATQVLIARHLAKSDYGSWALGLAVVAFFQVLAPIGLDRAIARFIPIFDEEKRADRLLGTILLVLGTTLASSTLIIAAIAVFPQDVSALVSREALPVSMLLIMMFLIPLEALDSILTNLFACFGQAKAIFARTYLLAPILKFAVAVMVIAIGGSVLTLAAGYLVAAAIGITFYTLLFRRQLHSLHTRAGGRIDVPAREILSFSLPLLSSDVVSAVNTSLVVFLLARAHGLEGVATFRVVLPLAALNALVVGVFSLMFTPAMSRLLARGDRVGAHELYWHTTAWIAVFSFPVFAATFTLAEPLIKIVLGARYADSALPLSLLAVGQFFSAVAGMNGLTLKVLGRVRYTVITDTVACVVCVALALVLVPQYGAIGAAGAVMGTAVAQNVMRSAGLRRIVGVLPPLERAPLFLAIAGAAVLLALLRWADLNQVAIALVVAATVVTVLYVGGHRLRLSDTFPEIARIPAMRRLFA